MERAGLPALVTLCAAGSLLILAFLGLVAWASGEPFNRQRAILAAIVAAAWCARVVLRRRAWLAELDADRQHVVAIAGADEVLAGVDVGKPVTPASLASRSASGR